MLDYSLLDKFESALSEYTGAPYVVLTDSCTHALELCMRYKNPGPVVCKANTYVSVPMMLHKLGVQFFYDPQPWEQEYRLVPSNIWDSARGFRRNMYRVGQLQCLSFGPSKTLEIGHGGAILTNKKFEYDALRRMAYDGRDLSVRPWQNQKVWKLGFHYGMRLEDAQRGIHMLAQGKLRNPETQRVEYPDCSRLNIDLEPK